MGITWRWKMRRNVAVGLVVASVFTSLAGSAALADCSPGAIANFLCNTGVINKDTANALDHLNKQLGQPVDKALEALGAAAGAAAGM
jgi:hypothetical protein